MTYLNVTSFADLIASHVEEAERWWKLAEDAPTESAKQYFDDLARECMQEIRHALH